MTIASELTCRIRVPTNMFTSKCPFNRSRHRSHWPVIDCVARRARTCPTHSSSHKQHLRQYTFTGTLGGEVVTPLRVWVVPSPDIKLLLTAPSSGEQVFTLRVPSCCRQIKSHGRCRLRHGRQYERPALCQGRRLHGAGKSDANTSVTLYHRDTSRRSLPSLPPSSASRRRANGGRIDVHSHNCILAVRRIVPQSSFPGQGEGQREL